MIVGEQKTLEEIMELLGDARKVLEVGCGTCTTACFAGGEKQVGILASALRMKSQIILPVPGRGLEKEGS